MSCGVWIEIGFGFMDFLKLMLLLFECYPAVGVIVLIFKITYYDYSKPLLSQR